MRTRAILLVLVALVLAGGTVFLARGWLNAQRLAMQENQSTVVVEKPSIRVLVAKEDLPAGRFVKPEHLRWQAWPDDTVAPTYVIEDDRPMEDFVGGVVRASIAAGQPITDIRVVKPGQQGFLAAVLEPGMRAVSVSVNAETGLAGFVFPGDRVDVILTHGMKEEDAEGNQFTKRASETVLQNVRILAVDQSMNDQSQEAAIAKTATLELTPKQAEILTVTAQLGVLSLSLRGLQEEEAQIAGGFLAPPVPNVPGLPQRIKKKPTKPSQARTYTWDTEVSRLINRSLGSGQTVEVFRGTEAKTVELK